MKRIYLKLRLIAILLFLLTVSTALKSQVTATPDKQISLLFIGDIMGHDTQIWSAENRETHTYNYDDVFRYIKPLISEADIAIANLEVTLAGPPYKGYPQFSSPADLAVACHKAGIDYLVTANNHAADRGKDGIISTINKLDSLGIPHTGTFLNQACRDSLYPLMISSKGTSIALLNYTFSTNGIRVPEPVIVNMLDKELITKDIIKARTKKADLIILFLHWGTEYDTIPSGNQTNLAEYFLKMGVDLVIGSHPHVLQKMVWIKNPDTGKEGIIVYSLGNFITNQRKPKTDGGSMVRVLIKKEGDAVKIINAGYYLTWVYTPIEEYRLKFFILPCTEFENRPDFFSKASDYSQMMTFIERSRDFLNKENKDVPEIIFKMQLTDTK
jgi:poly-gamma-glutamate capsule biosynthesis protein CapA/YwtB (metallophosphatase superfamily)